MKKDKSLIDSLLKKEKKEIPKDLPLVVEIIPGAAEEGLVRAFNVGEYDIEKNVKALAKEILSGEYDMEEGHLIQRINKEINGGKYLIGEEEVNSKIRNYVAKETTEDGLDYLYLQLRIVRPQEGGF